MSNVIWFNSVPPRNKFAPNLKIPLYRAVEGNNLLSDKLTDQILSFEKQITEEKLVSEVPKNEIDPYSFTQHWKQHNLFWDKDALGGNQLQRFPMTGELTTLFHIIRKNYLLFLKELNYPRMKVYAHAWANVLRDGEWISRHHHMNDDTAYLSGTYYLSTVPTELSIISPIRPDHMEVFPTIKNNIIFFPAWVPHQSSVYKGSELRISIAIDIVMEVNIITNPWRPHVLFDDPDTMEGFEMYLKDRSLTQ